MIGTGGEDVYVAGLDTLSGFDRAAPVGTSSIPKAEAILLRMDGSVSTARSTLEACRWACVALVIAALFTVLASPAMSQGQVGEILSCGGSHDGEGFSIEAGGAGHPTTCRFARATYRAYRKWSRKHAGGHSHFRLPVKGHRLACRRGLHEAEVGEAYFEVRCHDRSRLVEMYSEKGL